MEERMPDMREIVDVIKYYHRIHSGFEEIIQSTCDFFGAHGEGEVYNYVQLARFVRENAKTDPAFDLDYQAA
jgi:hypothetical protein